MKDRAALLLAFSAFFLLLGLACVNQLWQKTLWVAMGFVLLVIGIVFVVLCRRGKWHWLAAGGLLLGYGLYLALGFRSADLGNFFPDGCTVESVDIISAATSERIIWTPGGGEPALSEQNGRLFIDGGSADGMAQRAEELVICNYWRPGAAESTKVSEISVYFTGGDVSGRLSLYQNGGAEYSISAPRADESRQWNRGLIFGDLTDLLPDDVADLLP